MVWQVRSNTWMGTALRKRFGFADTEQCPHCVSILDKKTGLPCGLGKYDDGHHAACVCPHPVLNKMITDRHNAAVHKVADEIRNAHHEREWHLLVHAGTKFSEELGSPLPSTTIPAWAIPNCKACPDVVLIQGWDQSMKPPTTLAERNRISFTVADLTYCRGDCSLGAIERKQKKYDYIMDELRARGFEVHGFTSTSLLPKDEEEVAQRIGVLALGITGEVFTANQHVMSALGLNAQATARLIKALHIHTIKETQSILGMRVHLDSLLSSGPQPVGVATATLQQPTGVGTYVRR